MDILTLMLAIGAAALGLLGKLVASELQDWLPMLARLLIDHAVKTFPIDQQPRYREELYADLEEYPGKLTRLYRALCIYRQSNSLKKALAYRPTRHRPEYREYAQNLDKNFVTSDIALASSPSLTVDPPFGFFDHAGVFRDPITTAALLSNVNRFARDPAVMKFLGQLDSFESQGVQFYNCSSLIAMIEQYQKAVATSEDASEVDEIKGVLQKLIQ